MPVRPLTAADAAALDLWFITQGRRDLAAASFLADDHVIAVGAFVADDLVGGAWGHVLARPDGAPMALLYDLAVEEEHRRHGIGRALLDAFCDRAREAGCGTSWLITGRDDAVARRLYDAAGGTAEDDRVLYRWALD